ncbi:MAG: response regulator [Desulfobacterales bacterium]
MIKDDAASEKEAKSILVIEDEEMVLEVAHAMIERMGYAVLSAANGAEAVRVAEQHRGKIHLAILDLGLPDMEGKEVYSHLIRLRPEMRIIVCSGDSAEGTPREIMKAGARGFIQKPYNYDSLLNVITKVLKSGDSN